MEKVNNIEMHKKLDVFVRGEMVENLVYQNGKISLYKNEKYEYIDNVSEGSAKKVIYMYLYILDKNCSKEDLKIIASNIQSLEDMRKNNFTMYQLLSDSVKKDKELKMQIDNIKKNETSLVTVEGPFSKIHHFFRNLFKYKKQNIDNLEMKIAGTGKYVSSNMVVGNILESRNAMEDFEMISKNIKEIERDVEEVIVEGSIQNNEVFAL